MVRWDAYDRKYSRKFCFPFSAFPIIFNEKMYVCMYINVRYIMKRGLDYLWLYAERVTPSLAYVEIELGGMNFIFPFVLQNLLFSISFDN